MANVISQTQRSYIVLFNFTLDSRKKQNQLYEMERNLDTCTPMFIAAPLTIAKLWNEPRCPPTDE
jgi:hypothetical protein